MVTYVGAGCASDVTIKEASAIPTRTTPNRHHGHHQHKRESIQNTSSFVKRDKSTSTDTGDDMPAISSKSDETSYSYSIAIPNSQKTEEPKLDPYIFKSSLPENLVFIIVGAIIGFVLLCLMCYRVVTYIISNLQAKSDREVYYHNFGFSSPGAFGTNSSSSSMLEKTSLGSVSSLHALSRHNSVMLAQHDQENSSASETQPGRSYRNAVSDNKANRGSMFISPVLQLMHSRSQSQLDLPLYHKSTNEGLNNSLASVFRNLEIFNNSPINSTFDSASYLLPDNSKTDETMAQQTQSQDPRRMKRPPSMVLDNLIN